MDRRRIAGALVALTVSLGACSGGSGPSLSPGQVGGSSSPASSQPTTAATETPTATPLSSEPSATETDEPTGVPTALDPCQIVTPAEASSLTGGSFSAGQESTTEGNGKLCTYGQEGIVFEVLVGVAPDQTTAQSEEDSFRKEIEKNAGIAGSKLTELPGFETGVDAAIEQGQATISGVSIGVIGMYIRKGTTFLALSDISTFGAKPPTAEAMETQAHTSLGRVP